MPKGIQCAVLLLIGDLYVNRDHPVNRPIHHAPENQAAKKRADPAATEKLAVQRHTQGRPCQRAALQPDRNGQGQRAGTLCLVAHVLERLPLATTTADYEALLPWNCGQVNSYSSAALLEDGVYGAHTKHQQGYVPQAT